jgi:glucosamine--fructose-6-phosphate aminotransferase (isomerizing)
VLALSQSDETQPGSQEVVDRLRAAGAVVFAAGLSARDTDSEHRRFDLPVVPEAHAVVAPLTLTQTCYGLVEVVARCRGIDPDRPAHLSKVTRTR